MSAESVQHKWKQRPPTKGSHDAGSLLTNSSTRAQWLLVGLIDRALSHWVRAPPLDGEDDDGVADTGTDTATPEDDHEEIASRTGQQSTSLQHPSFWSCVATVPLWECPRLRPFRVQHPSRQEFPEVTW